MRPVRPMLDSCAAERRPRFRRLFAAISAIDAWCVAVVLVAAAMLSPPVWAQSAAPAASNLRAGADARVRVIAYDPDQVIRLRGYVGYQIHFQFDEGEQFVNLGAGDNKALDVGAERNHLVLKPLAEKVATNITLFTNRRVYHFDYSATRQAPDPKRGDVIYSLRFTYPEEDAKRAAAAKERERLAALAALAAATPPPAPPAEPPRPRNMDYWFCGAAAIRPVAAFDDGVQTRLRFGARSEFPAMYVKNDDNTESLLNFTVEGEEVVIHRVARRFVLRRGQLVGCIENRTFDGGGERLPTETLLPGQSRHTRGAPRS